MSERVDGIDWGTFWQLRVVSLIILGVGVHGWLWPNPQDPDPPLMLVAVGTVGLVAGEVGRWLARAPWAADRTGER